MKKAMIVGIAIFFLVSLIFSPVCFAQGDKGKAKGGKKKGPTHEEFVAMYDKDGNGEVSMDEFLEGPKEGPAGGGEKGPPPPGGKKGKKGPK